MSWDSLRLITSCYLLGREYYILSMAIQAAFQRVAGASLPNTSADYTPADAGKTCAS